MLSPKYSYVHCVECGLLVRLECLSDAQTKAAKLKGLGYIGVCPSCKVNVSVCFDPPSIIAKPGG